MSYIKISTLEYPVFEGDIRLEHPDISESLTGDAFPLPNDYAPVVQSPYPEISASQFATESQPTFSNGVWSTTWSVRDLTEQEIAERDALHKKMTPKFILDGARHATSSGSSPDVIM